MRALFKQLVLSPSDALPPQRTGRWPWAASNSPPRPLVANLVGWLVAFAVSFIGHYRLTFRHSRIPWTIAIRRFFLVSAAGFLVNESAYAWLLHATAVRYDVLLALILIGLAVLTFVVSRLWRSATNPLPERRPRLDLPDQEFDAARHRRQALQRRIVRSVRAGAPHQ